MKKQTKMVAVLSAAALMTMISGVSGAVVTAYAAENCGWIEEDGSMVYYDEDGYLMTDTWKREGDDWYYLGEDGRVAQNSLVDEFYVGNDGKMVKNTWIEIANEEDPDSPEAPATYWYYFDEDGKSVTDRWMKQKEQWYYFNEDGHMMTGKVEIDGSTYYLGDENDGTLKTGWIKLKENVNVPGADDAWYYFNPNGKMVETQYDKKIGDAYYTFIDGRMQTGWVEMPKAENESVTDTATDSNAAPAPLTIADYQYYGKEGDGKRAEGWHTIEGIDGIHDMDETYTFYFRRGNAHASETRGNELFSVGGKKYAFDELGAMQTGQQIVNIENGEIANFYFGEDGAMKTGKQTIYNEESGENENWYFHTEGSRKGQGYHGLRDNTLYVYGKRQEASSDLRYAPAELGEVRYLVNTSGTVQKASSSSTSDAKPELGRGFKDFKDSNGTIWTVNTNGIIQ